MIAIGIGAGVLGSGALLAALRAVHRQIEVALGEIEATTTTGGGPDLARVSAFRLRIAQANLARGQVAQKARRHLLSRASKREADALWELERHERMHFQSVSDLVRRWTPERVYANWTGYCEESAAIRDSIRQSVTREKTLLYPLLERMR